MSGSGAEKTILQPDYPQRLTLFSVTPDGERLYFCAADGIAVLDRAGQPVDRFGVHAPRGCLPLPDGRLVVLPSHAGGRISLYRADGSEQKVLVRRGRNRASLRPDGTGWTSPTGGAVDPAAGLIFALDVTVAPRDDRQLPDPDWSRIAVFDLDGNFVRDFHAFSAYPEDQLGNDTNRTWYDDIALDRERRRVYVTARRRQQILAFTYDGEALDRRPGIGATAVFPDGRVAVVAPQADTILIYSPQSFELPAAAPSTGLMADPEPAAAAGAMALDDKPSAETPLALAATGIVDLETDAGGRLYASLQDPTVAFIRWSADLQTQVAFGPEFLTLQVGFGNATAAAGETLTIPCSVSGRPPPAGADWHVFLRPADGSDRTWLPLSTNVTGAALEVALPLNSSGLIELGVRFGAGQPTTGDAGPMLQTILAVHPTDAGSITVVPDARRLSYRAGEAIPVTVVLRESDHTAAPRAVQLSLTAGPARAALSTFDCEIQGQAALQVPAALTRRLTPGRYRLAAATPGLFSWPLALQIGSAEADSPMQRIQYHEFGQQSPFDLVGRRAGSVVDQMVFLRDYAADVSRLGFTRQTDRLGNSLIGRPLQSWLPNTPAALTHPADPPPAAVWWPTTGWQVEYYLDLAVSYGLSYDTQMLVHCAGVRGRPYHLERIVPAIQRIGQWLQRFPSFYGFNYNDEMFLGGGTWTKADSDWLQQLQTEAFRDRPLAEARRGAVEVMYAAFNAAVAEATPAAHITTTPMWQFPAVEGSYAPSIYRQMDESYTHYLSEGYNYPWYPAHSVAFLKRPAGPDWLPIMAVFDNTYGYQGHDGYLQDLMQVLGRGVQGVGVQHFHPWQDPLAADSYRVGNTLAKMYGSIYAKAEPIHEGAMLYSYAQDISEHRNVMGTPHWERVFELHGAALMASLPMAIVYEEDLAAGWLLAKDRPRVPLLFLAGQTEPLPAAVEAAIGSFVAAGGRLLGDAATTLRPGQALAIEQLPIETYRWRQLYAEGMDADTIYELTRAPITALAGELKAALADGRRLPLDSSDPWVAASAFDGGAITYVHVCTDEGAPLPFTAPEVWSMGGLYRFTTTPRTATLMLPPHDGIVFDVFAGRQLPVLKMEAGRPQVAVDLRTMPGRLLALLPSAPGAPRLTAEVMAATTLSYSVQASTADGRPLAGRLPLRLRLFSDQQTALEIYRSTDLNGVLAGQTPLPLGDASWQCEVVELLSGRAAVVTVAVTAAQVPLAEPRPRVDVRRGDRVLSLLETLARAPVPEPAQRGAVDPLLKDSPLEEPELTLGPAKLPPPVLDKAAAVLAPRQIGLSTAAGAILSADQIQALREACAAKGVELVPDLTVAAKSEPAVYLVAEICNDGTLHHPLLQAAQRQGLLPLTLAPHLPGPGRGLLTAVYAPRGRDEHLIALIGGDAPGLAAAVVAFTQPMSWPRAPAPSLPPTGEMLAAAARNATDIPRVDEMTGVRLDRIIASSDGNHLLAAARGYLKNLALIEDLGTSGHLIQTERAGGGPRPDGLWLQADGSRFGASVRSLGYHGNQFQLFHRDGGQPQRFSSFGDWGRTVRTFGVSAAADTIIAPGPYGAVCWRVARDGVEESWRDDAWRRFADLSWPITNDDQRNPDTQAFIPDGGEMVLLVASEKTNQGWIGAEHTGAAWLRALRLQDGAEMWRFDVPVKGLLFPTLHASGDGRALLLQVQVGAWGSESYRFYRLDDGGKLLAQWQSEDAPLATAVGSTGRVAIAYRGLTLELRRADGSVTFAGVLPHQPISLALAGDGRLYLADDAGMLSCVDTDGNGQWQVVLGAVSHVAAVPAGVVAAGWDGWVRAYTTTGAARWQLDCTPAMLVDEPLAALAKAAVGGAPYAALISAGTVAATSTGENLLRNGAASLALQATVGWKSEGRLEVEAAALTNGELDDLEQPWLHLDEVFWAATAGRQVVAEIAFREPTVVHCLTVHEHTQHPEAWPTDAVVQVWRESDERWATVAYGAGLSAATNSYDLAGQTVTRLRYVPLANYFHNLFTCEIEIR